MGSQLAGVCLADDHGNGRHDRWCISVFGTTLQTVGQALSHPDVPAVSGTAGRVNLSVDDLRREIESVLRATGKPGVQPEELQRDATRTVDRARQGEPPSRIADRSLVDLRNKLAALDREAAVHFMVNKLGMSDAQAKDVVQSTIGLLGPAQDIVRGARQRAAALGAEALDRLGMIALWLSGLALISLVISAIGGMIGTPDEVLVDSTARTESYRDMRRAS